MMSQQTINQLPARVQDVYGDKLLVQENRFHSNYRVSGYRVSSSMWTMVIDCAPGSKSENEHLSSGSFLSTVFRRKDTTAMATTAEVRIMLPPPHTGYFRLPDGRETTNYQTLDQIMDTITALVAMGDFGSQDNLNGMLK